MTWGDLAWILSVVDRMLDRGDEWLVQPLVVAWASSFFFVTSVKRSTQKERV